MKVLSKSWISLGIRELCITIKEAFFGAAMRISKPSITYFLYDN
jgi:hypothetical protein